MNSATNFTEDSAADIAVAIAADHGREMLIPANVRTVQDFRRWARSDRFPEQGRIDYVNGVVEIDMSPEELFSHGAAKGEIYAYVYFLAKRRRQGHTFCDRARVSCPAVQLSAEPDVVFISLDSIQQGRVRLVPKAGGKRGRFVEIEGAADMIAEILSDSSIAKDTQRLPPLYFAAGVREYWLVDALGEVLRFQIHRRGKSEFEPVEPDADGFQWSEVFGCHFRLDGHRDEDDIWSFDLLERDA